MAATGIGKAPLAVYVVALLAHGVLNVTSMTVQVGGRIDQDIDHRNASRTSTHKQVPALTDVGMNPSTQLGECQGDCDSDSDCVSGLICFQRDPSFGNLLEVVPGCSGTGTDEWDYCYQAPTPAPAASATGDPHLQNIHGERFDLMRPGNTVLIQIPRGVPVQDSMLTVVADAVRLGESCADLYFQMVNITGTWASSDIHFNAQKSPDKKATWLQFGPIEVKVAHGHTEKGEKYLNVFVKHLGRAATAVGGLLGEDDHTEASTPPAKCRKTVALHATRGASKFGDASVAIAAI